MFHRLGEIVGDAFVETGWWFIKVGFWMSGYDLASYLRDDNDRP